MKMQRSQNANTNTIDETKRTDGLRHFHVEAGATGVEEAGNAYQSASLVAAGSGFTGVGMLSAITNLVTAFLYLQVPGIIAKLGSRKRAVVVLSFLDTVSWLPIIVLVMWFRPVSLPLLISLWIVNLVPGMLAGAARNSWLADLTTTGSRGKYLGIRSSILNAAYLTSFYVMGYLLQVFSGDRIFTGFVVLFFISFAATAVSFFTYTRIPETPNALRETGAGLGFMDFLGETTKRNLGRLILFAALFNFTVYLAAPFFAVYMLDDLNFSYISFAIVSSSDLVAKIVAVTFWGKHADKVGNLKVLRTASMFIPVVPIMWLVSHNIVYLVAAQVLSGIMWAGFDLCVVNFIYGAVSPEKRLRYILYHQTLSKVSMALGALTGVILLSRITPVLGSRILALFLLSGLLRFAVVFALLPKLRETPKDNQLLWDMPARAPAVAWVVANDSGLPYRPRQWRHFSQSTPTEQPAGARRPGPVASDSRLLRPAHVARAGSQPAAASGRPVGKPSSNRGIFYRPRDWHWFGKPSAARAPEIALSRGIFYRPRDWHWFGGALGVTAAVPSPVRVPLGRGVYYRPRDWSLLARQL